MIKAMSRIFGHVHLSYSHGSLSWDSSLVKEIVINKLKSRS